MDQTKVRFQVPPLRRNSESEGQKLKDSPRLPCPIEGAGPSVVLLPVTSFNSGFPARQDGGARRRRDGVEPVGRALACL